MRIYCNYYKNMVKLNQQINLKKSRVTEKANSNRISVAVVDEVYGSYTMGKYYKGIKRLDR